MANGIGEYIPGGWAPVTGRAGWYAPPSVAPTYAREEERPPKEEYLIPPVDWAELARKISEWMRGRDVPPPDVSGMPYWGWGIPGMPEPRAERAWRAYGEPPPMAPEYFPSARGMYQPWQTDVPIKREGLTPVEQWQLQAKEWELGQYGYIVDPETGMPRRAYPWEQPPTTLQPVPERLRLPPEWAEWYAGLATPEYHPKGNVEYYAGQYTGVPVVTLPEKYPMMTDEEKVAWLSGNAYETVYTDQYGNIIDQTEVMRRATLNPNEPIRQVFMLGGGEIIDEEFPAGQIQYRQALKPSPTALERRGEVIGGRWFGEPTTAREGEALVTAREGEAVQRTLDTDLVKSILASGYTYEQKLNTITDLYSQYTGMALTQRGYYDIRNTVQASLPPEELEALRGRETRPPKEELPPAEKGIDVAALSESLAPYGVNLTANYPFVSPITEEHLMRIPSNILEQMARYLEEKGMSWRDFLEVSSGWYGGGAARGFRWQVPRQWG